MNSNATISFANQIQTQNKSYEKTTNPASATTSVISNRGQHIDPSQEPRASSNGFRFHDFNCCNPDTDMETLAYNPARRLDSFMNSHSGYGNHRGGPIPQSGQMSTNFSGTGGLLGILNAEIYDDGSSGMNLREKRTKRQPKPVIPFGLTEASGDSHEEEDAKGGMSKSRRKRNVTEITSLREVDEDEEARKKARGRPRVDTKDETAADRRRTQIRMAQRAYRHRKETTITSLEKQVQDLRGTIEEMNNILITLYNFAVGKGLLQREPEFGQQLQSTTERFLALTKATVNDDGQDETFGEYEKQADPQPARRSKGSKGSPKKRPIDLDTHMADPVNPWGGYTFSKDDTPEDDLSMDFTQNNYEGGARNDRRIITRPTEDNASFLFDLMDLQQYHVDLSTIEDFSHNFLPESQPSLPRTVAYSEFSFARRIQRGSIERAFRLITSKSISPEVFNKVFGLTLRYETRENLEIRLRRAITKTNNDSLNSWRNPFVHIGGSGTFYPDSDPSNEDLRPKIRTGYSMGPFSPAATEAQDLFEEEMRCNVPGYEGEFFDANDVEGYLRGRGLDIPPSVDFITVEIDTSIFTEVSSPNSNSSLDLSSPKTPQSPLEKRLPDPFIASYSFDFTNPEPKDFRFPALKYGSWDSQVDVTDSNLDPIFGTLTNANSAMNLGHPSPDSIEGEVPFMGKRLVTINVQKLIDEILNKAVCLSRGAGFRQSDVNAAIVLAAKAGVD
ncbi:uncharacterized protein RAG0_13168 [Rhynchosporium agropyri]|uniref:BZIP domain-containing protein n=1 Tax=Rhynchosporium agropyri TaxID=914238 RepID=A0A1E1LDS7_9HELO|nr:uncharacterized protein RAG0_13168 [Rhynchosporium agropyri]